MSYKDDCYARLDADPSLQHDKHELAALVGCAVSTAKWYILKWTREGRIRWAMDAATDADGCDACPHVAACWELYALDLPVLCERVTQDDVQAAGRWAVLDAMQDAREAVADAV